MRNKFEIMKLANTGAGDAVSPSALIKTHTVAASSRMIAAWQAQAMSSSRGCRTSVVSASAIDFSSDCTARTRPRCSMSLPLRPGSRNNMSTSATLAAMNAIVAIVTVVRAAPVSGKSSSASNNRTM